MSILHYAGKETIKGAFAAVAGTAIGAGIVAGLNAIVAGGHTIANIINGNGAAAFDYTTFAIASAVVGAGLVSTIKKGAELTIEGIYAIEENKYLKSKKHLRKIEKIENNPEQASELKKEIRKDLDKIDRDAYNQARDTGMIIKPLLAAASMWMGFTVADEFDKPFFDGLQEKHSVEITIPQP